MDDEELGEGRGGNGVKIYSDGARLIQPDSLLSKHRKEERYSRFALAQVARRLHIELWRSRKTFGDFQDDSDPLTLVEPIRALGAIGYSVDVVESLGQYRESRDTFEVAGVIDKDNSHIWISRRFTSETRQFTLAHELGHAILHRGTGLHRDRAVDSLARRQVRSQMEMEADTFAAYFLMPDRRLRIAFEERFLTTPFELTDATAFALAFTSAFLIEAEMKNQRALARVLASAEQYNGTRFDSLAKLFGVSVEAMAIHLEELELVAMAP